MSPEHTPNDPHLRELYAHITPIRDHARQVASTLNADQLKWRPDARSWSVGDCLEHIIVVADLYYERIAEAIETSAKQSGSSSRWRPSFTGRLLIKSVTTSRRLKRPGAFKPLPRPREDVVDVFLRSQDRLAELMLEADGVDLTRTKVSSPVSRLFRLNLGDCFTVLVHHARRHLRQAACVAESRRMPQSLENDSKGS